MGLRPSPIGAVVRMYYLEKNSIYTDIHLLPHPILYYARYIDDAANIAKDRETALAIMQSIADQDEDGKIEWEIDFPEGENDYIPFLNSEIRIREDGTISSRLYRKPTKKWITLHAESHQPASVKVNTIRNSYVEARQISSGPEETQHSLQMVEKLYLNNGFKNPKQYDTPRPSRARHLPKPKPSDLVSLTLDFVSEHLCNRIRNEIKRLGLPIKVLFTSNNKLRKKLCSSRPYDKHICSINKCMICPHIITENKDCSVVNVVYRIDCIICEKFYIGETQRTAHERLGEHLRYAKYPNTPSNKSKALAMHYNTEHPGLEPNLKFSILTIEPNTVRRKIYEAMCIQKFNPKLNLKEELKTVLRFLAERARV